MTARNVVAFSVALTMAAKRRRSAKRGRSSTPTGAVTVPPRPVGRSTSTSAPRGNTRASAPTSAAAEQRCETPRPTPARFAAPPERTPAEAASFLSGVSVALAEEVASLADEVARERLLYLIADVLDAHDTLLELDGAA